MESTISHEQMGKGKGTPLDTRANITVLSRTRREADPDGRSIKAVVDGLVIAGVLQDDSAKFIKKVSQEQELTKETEETIITLEWE